jgi:hypothetical protein
VIRKDVLQELRIGVSRFLHVVQLPLGLLLPQEVQPGGDLDQSSVVRHHQEEHRQ